MMSDDPSLSSHKVYRYDYLPVWRYYLYFCLQVVSASMSLLGSATIIALIRKQRRSRGRCEVYHRLMIAISLADIVFDISIILQFLLVRADTMHPLAMGNIQTCSAIGFTTTFSFCVLNLYFVLLSIYFFLTIRWGKKERYVRSVIEPYGHIVAMIVPLAICIAAALRKAFNPTRIIPTCFMRPYPSNCLWDESIPCERGGRAIKIFTVMMVFAFLSLFIGILCTWLVYWSVRHQRKRSTRHSFVGDQSVVVMNRQRIRNVSWQAILYTFVFLVGLFASMFSSKTESIFSAGMTDPSASSSERLANNTTLAVFLTLYMFLCPLQGFLNLIIFVRPCYLGWRKVAPQQSKWWALQQALAGRSAILLAAHQSRHFVDGNVNETNDDRDQMDLVNTGSTDRSPVDGIVVAVKQEAQVVTDS